MNASYNVVVVGAGPAGATAAGYLAMHGHRTLLLERSAFPRHRIGESLLPSLMPVLEDFGLVDACREAGFVTKTGTTFIWGKTREPWDVFFDGTPFLPARFSFHVERARFDQILLDHARERGAEVRQNAKVLDVIIEGDRVVGVTYRDERAGVTRARARYVVDASGAASVIGRRVTTRRYDEKMRQIALYAYYRGVRGPTDFRKSHVIIESCPKGWFWCIPMNSASLGEASVGLVTGQEFKEEIKRHGAKAFYESALAEAPFVRDLVGPAAECITKIRGVRDWAYTCDRTAGPGFYLAGDAAAFLDPLLSTGVSLSMLAGYSASVCIHSALRDPAMELAASEFYAHNYRQMYEVTRDFLHYFYAGNASAHRDDFFWEARRVLKVEDNIGAKQAFGFLVNIIPGNPHPAARKQVPMFHRFMENLDHPLAQFEDSESLQTIVRRGSTMTPCPAPDDNAVPVVNGTLASSWVVDRESHTLKPLRGIAYDRERPVFSSTSSWLMGRNIAALNDDDFELLGLIDGEKSWSRVLATYARRADIGEAQARVKLAPSIDRLLTEQFVLGREVKSCGSSSPVA